MVESEYPKLIHISKGGPMRKISVKGRIIEFEMHPYCGPTILNKRTDCPLEHQPMDFLHAASQWAIQGEKIDADGLCIWYHEPEMILEHMGGKHYLYKGEKTAVKGS